MLALVYDEVDSSQHGHFSLNQRLSKASSNKLRHLLKEHTHIYYFSFFVWDSLRIILGFSNLFSIPPRLLQTLTEESQWDNQSTVNSNYSSFGVLFDPNSVTEPFPDPQAFDSDNLKSALGKKRKIGRSAPP
ncbi:hypothetical protein GmHk_12G035398 [Glycine max]|nr:hypothetical protein GmHk_12G035398 [Glycine max]